MESDTRNRYWENVLPLLEPHGFRPLFVNLLAHDPLQAWADTVGIPNIALNCRTSFHYPRAIVDVRRLIIRNNAAIVHCSESIAAALGGIAARSVRVPAVFHRHHCHSAGKRAVFTNVASRTCSVTMAVSRTAAEFAVRENRLTPDRVVVVRNGIAPLRTVTDDEVAALRVRLSIPATSPVITMVARLRPFKGHRTLFNALPAIAAAIGRSPHVLVVGSGPEEASLRQIACSIACATIHFIGHMEDVALCYRAADVSAMPSEAEGFGLVAVESMAAGVPLVASAVQGLLEIVEPERSGMLVPPRDSRALADAIVRVLTDSELRQRLVAGGRARYLAHFTTDAMARGWIECYRSVLSRTTKATATVI